MNNAVFVADRSNHRIQKWPAGNYRIIINSKLIYSYYLFVGSGAAVGITVAGQTGVSGTWSYQLNLPTTITFDQYNNMFVMDAGNSRIQRWLAGMSYGDTIVVAAMSTPFGMTLDFAGNVIVADTSNHRIVSFNMVCRK